MDHGRPAVLPNMASDDRSWRPRAASHRHRPDAWNAYRAKLSRETTLGIADEKGSSGWRKYEKMMVFVWLVHILTDVRDIKRSRGLTWFLVSTCSSDFPATKPCPWQINPAFTTESYTSLGGWFRWLVATRVVHMNFMCKTQKSEQLAASGTMWNPVSANVLHRFKLTCWSPKTGILLPCVFSQDSGRLLYKYNRANRPHHHQTKWWNPTSGFVGQTSMQNQLH